MKSFCLFSAIALGVASFANAQEFYVGTLLEPAEQEASNENSEYRGFIGLAGVRVPVSNTFFVAGETEISRDSAPRDVLDRERGEMLHRYRAHVGASLSNLSVFFGTTTRELTVADNEAAFETLYLNFGVDVSVTENVTIRFEAIQDSLSLHDGLVGGDEDRLRLGTLINF